MHAFETGGSCAHAHYSLDKNFLLPKHVYLISFSGAGKSSQVFGSYFGVRIPPASPIPALATSRGLPDVIVEVSVAEVFNGCEILRNP